MQKAVLKLDLHDERQKQKAFEAIATLHGIDKIDVDMEKQEMTVVGTVDPVHAVERLRKKRFPRTQIVYVGPAKEEEKKDGGDAKNGNNTDANAAGPVQEYAPPQYAPPQYVPPQHPQTYCVFCGSTRRWPCPFCT